MRRSLAAIALSLAAALVAAQACGTDTPPGGVPDAGPDSGPDGGPDGGPDAGPDGGPDAGPDGGPDGGVPTVNGCSSASYTDGSAPGFNRTVSFTFSAYTPRCLTVAVGQSVTFSGAFGSHPLLPGTAPSSSGPGSSGNPIAATSAGSSATFNFAAAGVFPYYCNFHEAAGMFGAIQAK